MATRKSIPGGRPVTKRPARPATAKRSAAAPSKTTPSAAGTNRAAESAKPKHKLVRDSFTIPKGEYAVLDELKQRATRLTRPAKKSEILRAGISALNAMSDATFLAALSAVPSLKTGRPKHAKTPADKAAAKKA